MKFALELESESLEIYNSILSNPSNEENAAFFEKMKDGCTNRVKTLERVRRENITEMILEPIKDFDSSDYELPHPTSVGEDKLKDSLLQIEEKKKEFYSDASMKIEFLIEASGVFEQLADENESNLILIDKHL